MINLLPYKEKKSIEKIRNIRFAQLVVLGLFFVCIAAILLLLPTFMSINYRYSLELKQMSKLEQSGMVSSDIDLPDLARRAKIAENKLSSIEVAGLTEHIDLLETLIPKGILVSRIISLESKSLEVSGVATNRDTLQKFLEILRKNQKISSVDSPVSNFIENKNSPFKISILFK
ncbi:hypothetical protein IT399_03820 [Candidatus Nomurabacteria bacterium]|nr:hypothetical protein [Candidatus Nomurabacteria bacterium]